LKGLNSRTLSAKRLRQLNSPPIRNHPAQAFCKMQDAYYFDKLTERKLPFKELLLLILMLAAGKRKSKFGIFISFD